MTIAPYHDVREPGHRSSGELSAGDSIDLQAGRLFTVGARLDVTAGRWSKMADVADNRVGENDHRGTQMTPQAVWTGSQMLLWPGDLHGGPDGRVPILASSPEHDRWATLGHGDALGTVGDPVGSAAWTGRQMIVFARAGVVALTPH